MQTNTPGSLKEKFGNFGAAPTEQLWDSISSSLDQNEKKRRGVFWWWFGGIAATVLLLVGIYYLGYQVGKNEKNLAEENDHSVERSVVSPNGSLPAVDTTGVSMVDPENGSDVSSNGFQNKSGMTASNNNDLEKSSDDKSNEFRNKSGITPTKNDGLEKGSNVSSDGSRPAVEKAVYNESNLTITQAEKMTRLDYPEVHQIALWHQDNFDASLAPEFEKNQSVNKWELGFSLGTQMSPDSKDEALIFGPGNGLTADYSSLENTVQGTGLLSSMSPMSGTISRPLSADISVARTFGPRWSLQSGLGINWMKSVTLYDNFELARVDASFFSLTIPVVAEFDFVNRKRFELSTGFGIVNEIPFYSRSSSVYSLLETTAISKSFMNGYMCSGLLNLGVSYRLTDKMKIGLHPNVRHYFFQSMKSDYPVLEKKTWIGANIGLIWDL